MFIKISCFLVGLLFAQAILLEATVPLFVPFYVALMRYPKSYRNFALAGGIIGALTLGLGQLVLIALQLLLFKIISRVKFLKQKQVLAVVISTTLTQIGWQLLFYKLHIPPIVQLYMLYEIVATGVLLLFFSQLFIAEKKLLTDWRYERLIAAIIIFSMLMLALQNIRLFNIAPATVLLHSAICCAAFYGPVAAAAFMATVMSVTMSMAQLEFSGMIALYALTGVFVGNAKRLGKYGIAILSLVPSVVFFFYDDTLPLDVVHFSSSAIGALLFIQLASVVKISKPKKEEAPQIVEQTVHDFERFTVFLHEMVELSLAQIGQQKIELTNFNVCRDCYRYENCWMPNVMEMKLKDVLLAKQSANRHAQIQAEQMVQASCIRSPHLLHELEHRIMHFQTTNQQYFSRKLVGNQLKDMSTQFQWLLQQAAANGEQSSIVEQRLKDELKRFECVKVDIEKMRHGYVSGNLHVLQPSDEQILVKVLTSFFGEVIELFEKEEELPLTTIVKYRFRSAIRFQMEYDIYNKTNAKVSGDQVIVTEIERGLQAFLVADGMGSGVLAKQQSTQLLFLLRQCLEYQLSAELALSTLQYLLNPTVLDSYATLDMLLFDLKKGELVLWKTGAMATYIVRGERVIVLESRFAPVGTLREVAEPEKVQLLAGDFVFISTDGIFKSGLYEEQERYFRQLLLQKTKHDWSLATILYEVMESYKARFEVDDDVTFIATEIAHTTPLWTAVKL